MSIRKSNKGGVPVRLSESKLKAIIAESMKKVLKEEANEYWWALWLTPKPTMRTNPDTYEPEYEETGIAELTLVKAPSLEEAKWIAEERFYKKYRDTFIVAQYRKATKEDFENFKEKRHLFIDI